MNNEVYNLTKEETLEILEYTLDKVTLIWDLLKEPSTLEVPFRIKRITNNTHIRFSFFYNYADEKRITKVVGNIKLVIGKRSEILYELTIPEKEANEVLEFLDRYAHIGNYEIILSTLRLISKKEPSLSLVSS